MTIFFSKISIVSPPRFAHDFPGKIFLMLYSINFTF